MRQGTLSKATLAVAGLTAIVGAFAGCSAQQKADREVVRPAGVTEIDFAGITDSTERTRIALSRFVGAWDISGWHQPPGEARRETSGIAAGTIENEYFVLIDTARVTTQNEVVDHTAGSILLSAEPGVGLMLTAWSSESPEVHRFKGESYADWSRFVFNEFRTPEDRDRLRLVMQFQTNDRWTAEFYRRKGMKETLAASYTFNRAD